MRQFSKVKVADYVRRAREARGLSLRQTAKKAGLTLARCFAIENGEARLNLPQLASLADAFGVQVWRRDADSLRSAERLQEASEAEKASDGGSMIPPSGRVVVRVWYGNVEWTMRAPRVCT
jgi:transcriptional regulator with XRE-family HTH domain